ncbi:MAG TPA: DUF6273 domain-containing protein, partial [Clostridia bacterium]|nr:DUF6273 domain-containing protein [Clostridia bacterium]
MSKVKRMIAILVSVLLFATALTACGKEELPEGITSLGKAKVGDIVNLGSYEQDNNTENGKEEVTWLVLAVDGKKTLLISEKVLDTKKYNDEKVDITWENSSMRTWLNNDFLKAAFTKKEAKKIIETTVKNADNAKHETPGGNDTKDKIFLLSMDEAEKYFETDELRRSKGTEFAASSGLKLDKSILYAGNSVWWLRTPGLKAYHACYVNNDGVIY